MTEAKKMSKTKLDSMVQRLYNEDREKRKQRQLEIDVTAKLKERKVSNSRWRFASRSTQLHDTYSQQCQKFVSTTPKYGATNNTVSEPHSRENVGDR